VECFFVHSGRHSCVFSHLCIFLLLPNCSLCIFHSVSCPSGLSLNIILNTFLVLGISQDVQFSLCFGRKLLFGSQAAPFPKGSYTFCF
jgi:hypothetical protein